ncbi:MAG: hypothetical protein WBY94_19555 [Polyangiaceae bacterium]
MKNPTETHGSAPSAAGAKPLDELLRHAREDGFTPQETEALWSQIGTALGPTGKSGGAEASARGSLVKGSSAWAAKAGIVLSVGVAIVAGGLAASSSTRPWHRPAPTPSAVAAGATGNEVAPRGAVENEEPAARSSEPTAGIAARAAVPVPGPPPAPGSTQRAPVPHRPISKAPQSPTVASSAVAEGPTETPPAPLATAAPAAGEPVFPGSSATPPSPIDPGINEGALLLRARRELGSNPRAALQLTEEHARLFPDGTLVPEREVLALEALVELGRTQEARARFANFRGRFPNSPHLARLEGMLHR